MKKNQTLSINKEVLIKIKKVALDRGTNLSALTEELYNQVIEESRKGN